MGKIYWNLWARAWVVAGCWCGALMAVSLMFYTDTEHPVYGPYLAYYLWATSAVLFPFFWPLEFLGAVRILTANHLVCFIITLLIAPFCFTRPPGIIPGFCYGVAAVLFIIGFIRREPTQTLDQLRGKAPPGR